MEERIAKDQWAAFLQNFDRTHHGNEACIEIIGREFGDLEEASWLPLSGISYDPHADQIIVTVGGINSRYPAHLTHMIAQPTQLTVLQPPEGVLSSIQVVSSDETQTLIRFRRPPQLTA